MDTTDVVEIKKRPKKEYWGKVEEDAVKLFLELPENSVMAERIFSATIYPALRKLVENICFTYHLALKDTPVNDQIDDCISHIVLKFRKYDPTKGTKAFSYFGTVAKNWFILQKNKSYSKTISTTEIDNTEGMEISLDLFIGHDSDVELSSVSYYLSRIADDIESALRNDLSLKPNTYRLGEAIVYLMRNYSVITVSTKNTFYHIVREMTGMTTKEISRAMRDIKEIYLGAKRNFMSEY